MTLHGKEAVIPLKSGKVPVQMEGGANNVNITINADVITTDDVDNWLADRVRRLKDYKVGDEYQTVNIMTAGLET